MSLKADTGSLGNAGAAMSAVAEGMGEIATVLESALHDAAGAVKHGGLVGALETYLGSAQKVHRGIHLGVGSLGANVAASGTAYTQADRTLGQRVAER